MILTRPGILSAISLGHIVVDPYNPELVNTNSVDVRVGQWLYRMRTARYEGEYMLPGSDPSEMYLGPSPKLPPGSTFSMQPGDKFLILTYEKIGSTRMYVPVFAGKSTSARHWLITHQAGGFGDVGYHSHWTMEIENGSNFVQYLTVGERIGQIAFYKCWPEIEGGYDGAYQDDKREPWELMLPKPRPRL